MSVSEYREDFSSLIPALHLLMNLGYTYLSPKEALYYRRNKTSQPILDLILREQLKKFNSFTFKNKVHSFTEGNIDKAIQEIRDIPFNSLITTNEKVYDLLTLGKSFEQTIDGYTRSFSLKYIDFENLENNVFHVCDEFVIERRHSHQTRRPDIVLFVNGIPLAVIECKRPDVKDSIKQGISQHIRNQGVDEIPHLFVYSQMLFSLSQNQAMYATTDTKDKFWAVWKEDYTKEESSHLEKLINQKLNSKELEHLFESRDDWQKQKMNELWNSGKRIPSIQDKTIYSLLRPERLLEITQRFIVYDVKEKKVPRYQQYFAIKETIKRITNVSENSNRPGGVIWHTTGSGKSITMVLLAKAITLEPSIQNPKVILVTDRVDLDDQIYDTFMNCGKQVVKATSGENLFQLIEDNKATVITTIIDKFESGLRNSKLKNESRDVFILVDESHRTQYGISHTSMKRVFPNACYIGFTGTPLLKKEKSTAKKFGGFIHKYSMNQAIADGAVTPLIYEGRMSELRGEKEEIDKWFDRITLDLTDEQKLDLKKKFRREEELAKSDERIHEIAFDVVYHFYGMYHGTGLKGQLAVSSRQDAIKYKKYFDEIGKVSSEIIMSPPDTREEHSEVSEENIPEVQRFWKAMMDKYGNPDTYQERIIDAFKKSDEPEILIVIDKLLTGFDAPKNTILYIDKRLKEHNILQAIARVNRLYDGKENGFIIDYRGIFGQLNDAIELYKALEKEGFDQEDVIGTVTNVLDEIKKLPSYHADVWDLFKEVENKKDTESMQLHLEPEDRRDKFYDSLRIFTNTLGMALNNIHFQENTSVKTIQMYKEDLKMFHSLRVAVKQRFGETVDYSSYETQIRNLVNKYIGAEEVKQIIKPVDIFKIEALEKELDGIAGDAAKADTIASRLKKTCLEKMQEDPLFYKKLSEVIDEAIAEHRAKRLSDAAFLDIIKDAMNEARNKGVSDVPERLKSEEEARAYYRVILAELLQTEKTDLPIQEIGVDIAIKTKEIITRLKKRDWMHDIDVINRIKDELEDYLFSIKGRFEFNWNFDTIDRLIEQTIDIAKSREIQN